jgi:hypothetical protein
MVAGDPAMCNNDPQLAAAAIAMDIPRAQSIEQARPTPLMTNPIQSRKRTLSQGSGLSVKEADSQSRKQTLSQGSRLSVKEADSPWATRWERRSAQRGKPNHITGWNAGDTGSVLEEPGSMKLAGRWVDGKDPSET